MRDQIEFIIAELRGMWRFRMIALVAAWIACLIGWVFVLGLQDRYASRAQVYVDTQSQLREVLDGGIVDSDVSDRLSLVTKALMGQQQLEDVVLNTDLNLRITEEYGMSAVISDLRKNVQIINDKKADPNLYTMVYSDPEPLMAKVVVETLLNNFVERSLGANREGSENAQRFLREELNELEAELVTAEQRLADFKRKHIGRMPREGSDYYSRLQEEIDGRDSLRSELNLLRRKRAALEAQLAGETPIVTTTAETGPVADLDDRLNTNRQRLAELSLRFTERHPDVIQTKSVIAELEQQRAQAVAELASGSSGAAADNPVYQSIKIELNGIDVEMAATAEQEAVASRRIADLQGLVDVLPEVEAELQRLNRDYGVKQEQFEDLTKRLEVAELSESAEKSEDVQFQIINPPQVPERPGSPNRPLLLAGVLLVGLGAGGGIAFLISQLKPVFHHATALRDRIGLPVLGSISLIVNDERRKKRVSQLVVFAGGIASLVVAFGMVLVFREQGVEVVRGLLAA
ncbi:MAG: XrtA system polysaccharide chain length determinant [Pseudomonadota bacterium]